ncbi:membrane dipeptidase [Edaphobacter acidisoli]|uniref:Membrane dipeptidase n=1 Tax=Edaphobacter acidisoli TaxID=2040573 RepID=A0A916RK54_9BACT|nr:dipeptidase [Edaphobacter acidisoli]GGA59539.1 membrane dipeptidase [Edaphobacter acidisoli]
MNRSRVFSHSLALLALTGTLAAQSAQSGKKMTPEEVHQSAIVVDTHADTPQRFVDQHWDFTSPLEGGMLNYDSAKKGNLDAQFFSIWVDPEQYPGDRAAFRTLELIDGTLEQVRKHPDKLRLCVSADDILQAHKDGKFAVLMGIEGGHSIEDSLGLLRDYYRLGVRYMTLTWSNTNDWADSSGDIDDPKVHHHDGLTPFGKQVVLEMNRLGMMVDISHVSDKTFWDTIATTKAPVIASHSSSRALTHAGRNMTDDMIRAVAKNGGVVMVNFYPAFIDEHWREAWNASRAERQKDYEVAEAPYKAKGLPIPFFVDDQVDRKYAAMIGRAPFDSLIDHFDHIIKVAGIDHVGIGTDFDGIPVPPAGIDSAADFPKITAALMARGYSAEDVRKVLGGNILRVFREVQADADHTEDVTIRAK